MLWLLALVKWNIKKQKRIRHLMKLGSLEYVSWMKQVFVQTVSFKDFSMRFFKKKVKEIK